MRIAVLIHPFGRFGGAERLAILHSARLAESGHDVVLYTDTSFMDRNWLSMLTDRVSIRQLPYGIKGRDLLQELDGFDRLLIHHHIEPFQALRIVRRYARKTYWYSGEVLRAIWEDEITGEDYRQFSPTVFGTAKHFYGRMSSIPLCGILYNFTISLLRVVDKATVRRYAGIIANSQYMAHTVRRIYRYQGPMFVAYPASSLPSSMFKPNYGTGNYVLIVGAHMPNKNHRALLEAISLLKHPPRLRIVGEGQETRRLKEQARNLGVDAMFESKVSREDLCGLYEKSLFVVVPSVSEPFGMTALEAALAGKPSIVTTLGGTKEFVVDQETGFVVHPRRTKDLASAMELLLNDENLRKTMGQKARERALDSFTLENSTTALNKALNQ
jgi:glycosyltransferase involved in cell wall biosynthesis